MNPDQKLIFRVEEGARYENLWVLVLIVVLLIVAQAVSV